jgi:hypothetical protein
MLNMFLLGCSTSSKILWKSQPQGDFIPDTRQPSDACKAIQQKDSALRTCTLITAKASHDEKECIEGMSPAGCFACKFDCR